LKAEGSANQSHRCFPAKEGDIGNVRSVMPWLIFFRRSMDSSQPYA
jgi:hypothetical protein